MVRCFYPACTYTASAMEADENDDLKWKLENVSIYKIHADVVINHSSIQRQN